MPKTLAVWKWKFESKAKNDILLFAKHDDFNSSLALNVKESFGLENLNINTHKLN